ncbi:PREDICTED: uncharacterized protein LOC105108592 isoform X3 [Populus euphratica]|uniref:Uncharacterized protein LOC105108592 isoform X3 n=1 Tax=Populus euphratica TaxID=75702 RepID=A0AAJ6X0I6_POPEU|nr:PREDICTED: uncharacterized protein LOC105108592 isoform X3 [Populus euphratica]
MYFQSECSDFRDGNMEWLHLRMVLFMEEETLGLGKGKDHSKVYWTNGKNIAGCYLGLDWEIKQQRNCFLNLAAGRTRMPLNLAEMITVGTHVCKNYTRFFYEECGSMYDLDFMSALALKQILEQAMAHFKVWSLHS